MRWRALLSSVAFVSRLLLAPLNSLKIIFRWCGRESAALQGMAALSGITLGILTLIYLKRYADDTRQLTQITQQQFAETMKEDQMRRVIEYEQMVNDDDATMPELLLTLIPAPTPDAGRTYIFMKISDIGLGNAGDGYLYDATSKQVLMPLSATKLNLPHSVSIPLSKWKIGDVLQLAYLSPHGSLRKQTLRFQSDGSQNLLSDTITRPFDYLLNDQSRSVTNKDKKRNYPQ